MKDTRKRRRRRRPGSRLNSHRKSVMIISYTIFLMGAMIFAKGITLRERSQLYQAQETELMEQIEDEKERAQEIDKLKDYVGTDQYVEDVAREKLGLIHENEILFRAE